MSSTVSKTKRANNNTADSDCDIVVIKEMTGIYTDPSLVQLVYALAGHEIVVKTTDQKIFKGVLEGVSPALDIALESAHEVKNESELHEVPRAGTVKDSLVIEYKNVESVNGDTKWNVPHVAFSTDKEYSERNHIANGTSDEPRELQLWTPDEDDHHANLLLETAGTGFSPDEMFQRNQELGVQSSYQPEMIQYSNVPVVIESKNALQEAQRLAAEIEGNMYSRRNAQLENEDEEQDILLHHRRGGAGGGSMRGRGGSARGMGRGDLNGVGQSMRGMYSSGKLMGAGRGIRCSNTVDQDQSGFDKWAAQRVSGERPSLATAAQQQTQPPQAQPPQTQQPPPAQTPTQQQSSANVGTFVNATLSNDVRAMQQAQRSTAPSTMIESRTTAVSSSVAQAAVSTANQQAATTVSIPNGTLVFHQSTSNASLTNSQAHATHARQPIASGGGNVSQAPQTAQKHHKTQSSYANLRDFGKGFHLKTMNPVSTAQQQYQNAPVPPPRHNAWMARDSSREQAKQQQQQIATPPPSASSPVDNKPTTTHTPVTNDDNAVESPTHANVSTSMTPQQTPDASIDREMDSVNTTTASSCNSKMFSFNPDATEFTPISTRVYHSSSQNSTIVNAENSTASTGTTMMEQQQQKQHVAQMQPPNQPYMTQMMNTQIQYPPSANNGSVQQANISVYNSPHVHHQQQAVYQQQQQPQQQHGYYTPTVQQHTSVGANQMSFMPSPIPPGGTIGYAQPGQFLITPASCTLTQPTSQSQPMMMHQQRMPSAGAAGMHTANNHQQQYLPQHQQQVYVQPRSMAPPLSRAMSTTASSTSMALSSTTTASVTSGATTGGGPSCAPHMSAQPASAATSIYAGPPLQLTQAGQPQAPPQMLMQVPAGAVHGMQMFPMHQQATGQTFANTQPLLVQTGGASSPAQYVPSHHQQQPRFMNAAEHQQRMQQGGYMQTCGTGMDHQQQQYISFVNNQPSMMIVGQPPHVQQQHQHSNVDMQRSQPPTPGPIVVAAPMQSQVQPQFTMMPQAYGIMPGVGGQQQTSQQFGPVGAGPYNQMYNQQASFIQVQQQPPLFQLMPQQDMSFQNQQQHFQHQQNQVGAYGMGNNNVMQQQYAPRHHTTSSYSGRSSSYRGGGGMRGGRYSNGVAPATPTGPPADNAQHMQ